MVEQSHSSSSTLRRKEDESKVRSLHFADSLGERLLELQTVPETEIMHMLTRSATNRAIALSNRKNLQAS